MEDQVIIKNSKTFKVLSILIVIIGVFIGLGVLYPTFISTVLNILWVLLLTMVLIFFALGILVLVGLKDEVTKTLEIFLEGSLTILDFAALMRKVMDKFKAMVISFILYSADILAYTLAFILYILLIFIYKAVGVSYDVTLLTILLTTISFTAIALLNRPLTNEITRVEWVTTFKKKFKNTFSDGLEVAIFIFFITMDSTNLFFLPTELNTEIYAQVGSYNLMSRAFIFTDHLRITLSIIIVTITIEIIRNIMRLTSTARRFYYFGYEMGKGDEHTKRADSIKVAIRQSFAESKDEIIKFLAYTTVLFLVFLFFPRLKIMTLAVVSINALILDFLIPARLISVRGTDLVSKIITKVFKL